MPSLPCLVVKLLVLAGKLTLAPLVVNLLVLLAATALWPYSNAKLAVLVAVISALILMSFCALRVNLLARQLTVSFTFKSPAVPLPPEVL